jgi:hypothetical protein
MLKKTFALVMVLLLTAGLAACTQQGGQDTGAEDDWKIGIMTGTVSQGEEEYVAAQEIVKKYGEDRVIHKTYPDNFMKEQETTITQIVSMAADPKVKAIVVCQAVPGTAAAIEKVRETRDDILFIAGVPHEDPLMIAEKADLCLETDNLKRGETIIELAHRMGAKKFLHYSFPRHMSYELLSKRRDIFRATCERLGIEFIDVTAPDPMGDAGIPGAQQFILEDVPRQVAQHGKDIALFSTNCAMQEPLIRKALDEGAIYPEQCCPSPYHAYPGALGIEIPPDKAGDVSFILEEIKKKVEEKGNSGRMATWKAPANMAMVRAGAEYAVLYAKGEVEGVDIDKVIEVLKNEAGEVQVSFYEGTDNFLMFVGESIIF